MDGSAAYLLASAGEPVHQCEILAGVLEERPLPGQDSDYDVEVVAHPLSIVLSQECDLDWDFRQRFPADEREGALQGKELPSVLLCEVSLYADIRGAPGVDPRVWRQLTKNREDRYQFLSAVPAEQDARGEGIAAMAVDFKRYFTIRTSRLYQQLEVGSALRRARLMSPYRDQVSQRFASFLVRVALPIDHGPLDEAVSRA